MDDVDYGVEYVHSRGIQTQSLGSDGHHFLAIAKAALSSDVETVQDRSFVRANSGTPPLTDVVAFVTNSGLSRPVISTALSVEISQTYATFLRVMCLRLWADSGFSSLEGKSTLFFPKEPRDEIPWGAELLWSDQLRADTVPDWYDDAFNSLDKTRRNFFSASHSYALLFALLHEIGHIKNCHHTNRSKIGISTKELEADCSAILSMLFAPHFTELTNQDAKSTILQMAAGVIASFLAFHLLLIKNTPATAGQVRHQGYPSVSERVSQLIYLLSLRKELVPETWFGDFIEVMRLLIDTASLHPAFGYVIGTGWISFGYSSSLLAPSKLHLVDPSDSSSLPRTV